MKDAPNPRAPVEENAVPKPEPKRSSAGWEGLQRRHLQIGWWSLLGFLLLGMLLEALHGFKVGGYLNVSAAPRRLMWTLAHAHGTLLALVHLGFAATLPHLSAGLPAARWSSGCLMAGGFLVPSGFLLGGWFIRGGDPGIGVFLVPVGALLLALGIYSVARGLTASAPAVSARK